ncbi:MAG: amino acid ABC transporter permease [Telmatospirillum sp.]|nr:amino acid ABC transporter permease [Telmatospirillum sp.]
MADLFDPTAVLSAFPRLLARIHVTLLIVLSGALSGTILGAGLAFVRLGRLRILNQAATVYISFMRGTPVIVQLFLVYYGLPVMVAGLGVDISRWDRLLFVLATYGLHMAAFTAEIFRAAILAIPRGQSEAAYCVGMSRWQAFRRIVAPQAVAIALPNLSLAVAGLLQDTSLAFSIGVVDVMGEARAIGGNSQRMLEAMTGAAIILTALSLLLEQVANGLERRLFSRTRQGWSHRGDRERMRGREEARTARNSRKNVAP